VAGATNLGVGDRIAIVGEHRDRRIERLQRAGIDGVVAAGRERGGPDAHPDVVVAADADLVDQGDRQAAAGHGGDVGRVLIGEGGRAEGTDLAADGVSGGVVPATDDVVVDRRVLTLRGPDHEVAAAGGRRHLAVEVIGKETCPVGADLRLGLPAGGRGGHGRISSQPGGMHAPGNNTLGQYRRL
jgi:hypothetical protein